VQPKGVKLWSTDFSRKPIAHEGGLLLSRQARSVPGAVATGFERSQRLEIEKATRPLLFPVLTSLRNRSAVGHLKSVF
jgi:hypothetical protein